MITSHISSQIYKKFSFEPTSEQKKIVLALSEYITSNADDDIFVIKGYAGTGKTSIVSGLVKTLIDNKINCIMLAPTGRAAKIMQRYASVNTYTIHRKIFVLAKDPVTHYIINPKPLHNTIFIIDEVSMIAEQDYDNSIFGSGNLLADLVEYVRSGNNNHIIFVGDSAQLPPVGSILSPALDPDKIKFYAQAHFHHLTQVVRQAEDSGILYNATKIRQMIDTGNVEFPQIELLDDILSTNGAELIETLEDSYSRFGHDQTIVLTRSNKRANRFNMGIRASILGFMEQIESGDRLMVIKNNYFNIDKDAPFEFIANGDTIVVERIRRIEQRYGFSFARIEYSMPDYNGYGSETLVLLDTLLSESASLTKQQRDTLFNNILEDYSDIKQERRRIKAVMTDKYFNALQVKFAYAITCHKAQGGGWQNVYIDTPIFSSEYMTIDLLRWIYTAITRATKKVFLISWDKRFFPEEKE